MTVPLRDRRTGWIPDDSAFGARLALIRQRMGWGNVKEAALACGVPVESWRNWERDGAQPRDLVKVALGITKRTGCDFYWLVAGREQQFIAPGETGSGERFVFPAERPTHRKTNPPEAVSGSSFDIRRTVPLRESVAA